MKTYTDLGTTLEFEGMSIPKNTGNRRYAEFLEISGQNDVEVISYVEPPKTFGQAKAEGISFLNSLGWDAETRELTKNAKDEGMLTSDQENIYLSNLGVTIQMFNDAKTGAADFDTGNYNLIDYQTFSNS